MAPINTSTPPALGTTVYWQQSPVVYHGLIVGTDCSAIKQDVSDKVCLVIDNADLTTTADG